LEKLKVEKNKKKGKWMMYIEEVKYVEGKGGGECLIKNGKVNNLNMKRRNGVEEINMEDMKIYERNLDDSLEKIEN
jgi:hypothetical protein